MGVSNVYNQAKFNAIAAIKSNMSAKGTKKAEALKPTHMRMTGSIFNAPGVQDSQFTPTIVGLNTRVSLIELNQPPIIRAQGSGSNSNPNNFEDIDNAADGKAAANFVSAQGDKVKAYTVKTKQQAGVVARLGSASARLDGKIVEANKKFTAENVKLQAQIKSDNIKLERVTKENIELQKEVDDAQNELDTLLARNSFSMGGSNSTSGSSDNQAKITELQTFIGSKVGVMQANGKIVYSLQRSQNRTLNRMQRTNSQYIKTHQRNTKALKNSQAEDSKIIKVATEVEKYSALAQAGGQMLNLAGRGLVALGTAIGSTGWGAAVGAALVATGQVMGKIGTVVELVGQYGQTAANLTKTAAYAAEGNIMGAMQSAASAVQMGTAAVKGTTGLKAQFKAIDQTATEATNKIAAKQIARETVTGDVGGMTKKEARKAMAANLEAQFNKGGIDGVTSTHNQNGRLKQLRKAANKEFTTTMTLGGQQTEVTTNMAMEALSNAQINYQASLKDALPKGYTVDANGIIKDASGNTVDLTDKANKGLKKTRNKVGKQAKTSFGNIKKSSTKSSTNWADNMNKFSQSFSSLAQMYMMVNGGGSMMGMMGSSMPSMNNMMGFGNSMMGMGNMRYVNNGMGYAGNTSHSTRKHQNPYATRHLTRSARA